MLLRKSPVSAQLLRCGSIVVGALQRFHNALRFCKQPPHRCGPVISTGDRGATTAHRRFAETQRVVQHELRCGCFKAHNALQVHNTVVQRRAIYEKKLVKSKQDSAWHQAEQASFRHNTTAKVHMLSVHHSRRPLRRPPDPEGPQQRVPCSS